MENNTSQTQEKIKILSPTEREVNLEIAPERVKQEYEKVLKDYVARVKLPGFRKGYAPKNMVQKMFDSEIKETVLENLINENLWQELGNLKVIPVSLPTVKSVDFDLDKGIVYQVSFEVWPEIKLPADYLEKKVEKEKIEVKDEEVERVLEKIREESVEYLPVSGRGVQDGDYVVIEIQGREVASKRLMPAEKIVVLAGHQENEPQLNQALAGLEPGQENNFTVRYPEDYREKRFAGKEIDYRIKVLEIKEKKIPELNDEFARTVDAEVEGLEGLKEKIRQDLARHLEEEAREVALNKYLEKLAEEINLTLPRSPVEEEAQALISREIPENVFQKMPPDLKEKVMAQVRARAEANLKKHLLMRKIASQEGLTVSDEELEAEIKRISENRNIPFDQLKAALKKEDREKDWRLNLLLRKTFDFLASKVII
jgi:trigger factor